MGVDLLRGERVRLNAQDAAAEPEGYARWSLDSEFLRLLDDEPAFPRLAGYFREDLEQPPDDHSFGFGIYTLDGGRHIGFIGLRVMSWRDRDGWVGVGIGDPAFRGKGCGTDAMCVLQRYAFLELGLRRLTLGVFADNPRAIRSYEKAGFVVEGRVRQDVRRDDWRLQAQRPWPGRGDTLWMGLLRQEWKP